MIELTASLNRLDTIYALNSLIGKVVASHAEGCIVDSRQRLRRFILCTRRSGGIAHEGEVVTASQLDLPYLTPLYVAGSGQLELGVAHWATPVALL